MVSKMRFKTTFFLLLIHATVFSFALFAQNMSGSITGIVQDTSGAVILGARATLINQEQGVTARQTITNEEGIYLFAALSPAVYTVMVELPGFKSTKRRTSNCSSMMRWVCLPQFLKWVRKRRPFLLKRNPIHSERFRPNAPVLL